MGKKFKGKKPKRKKFKSLKRITPPRPNQENPDLDKNKTESNPQTKKTAKDNELAKKEKSLKKKLKKMERENKKSKDKKDDKNLDLDYNYLEDLDEIFMNQEDVDQLPHDKFFTYPIPNTQEENKDYIPLLISESDIILELLDARDILHSRNTQIEELINNNANKLLIYIITKSDLVSKEHIIKIKKYLQKEAKKEKNQIIDISSISRETIQNLFNQLKKNVENLQKKYKDKKIIKIGIIGPPNVGKNSLIQSLELLVDADCTEKYIYFDEDKKFCVNSVPGVLFDEKEENNFLISKKCKNLKEISEPRKLIINLLNIVDKDKLKNLYELNKTPEDLDDFISLIRNKYEFRERNMSICKILEDIITGKIKYEIEIK